MGALGKAALYRLLSQEEKLRQLVQEDPIIACVDMLLNNALEMQASDIHIQPEEAKALVRLRVDGVLHERQSFSEEQYRAIVSRLKLLAHLDIAEQRLPQDGKFTIKIFDQIVQHDCLVDIRVATFPTMHGEKIVLRILDSSTHALDLDMLGMPASIKSLVLDMLHMPYGFFITTGPTGSGKTTTLYAMLRAMSIKNTNIVTLEDPVEYSITGIMQSQVNQKIGFTFDTGLRSLLRQDPDVIMIGEIRDASSLNIALEASLTGHLVISSLHTNTAIGAITRMLDMGVEPFVLASSLTAVLGQRLVRRLCAMCKEQITEASLSLVETMPSHDAIVAYKARGCGACNQLGYKGRIGLFELCLITDQIRSLIMKKSSEQQIKQALASHSYLISDAKAKLQQGLISYEDFCMLNANIV